MVGERLVLGRARFFGGEGAALWRPGLLGWPGLGWMGGPRRRASYAGCRETAFLGLEVTGAAKRWTLGLCCPILLPTRPWACSGRGPGWRFGRGLGFLRLRFVALKLGSSVTALGFGGTAVQGRSVGAFRDRAGACSLWPQGGPAAALLAALLEGAGCCPAPSQKCRW